MKNRELQHEVKEWVGNLDPELISLLEESLRKGELTDPDKLQSKQLSERNIRIRKYLYHILRDVERTSSIEPAIRAVNLKA